ncbi:MAG: type II toxin-antitoxin system VapC family toxin [bacterium]|nr:type II toxin-antitoxin system VapC family toxin [bacterium]
MKRWVLDSSVVVKWFNIEEKDADKACRMRDLFLQGEIQITVPELLFFELSNALKYSYRLSNEEIKEGIENILDIEIEVKPFDMKLLKAGIDMAVTKDITVYDAYFVALSFSLGSLFLTADERLWQKTKGFEFVKLLKEV